MRVRQGITELLLSVDNSPSSGRSETRKSDPLKTDVKHVSAQDPNDSKYVGELNTGSSSPININVAGDVNMEASITTEDVIRAGGFGATDDIGSFLPVAVDSTDFEASLRDAREFEESPGEISRPGLGYAEAVESEQS